MKRNWTRDYLAGLTSRRDFVERAAVSGLGFAATSQILLRANQDQARQAKASDFNQTNLNPYDQWRKQENIPLYGGYSIPDVRNVVVKPWKRMGVKGAYLDLMGGEGVNDGYVCEIPPGGQTIPQRYLFEEVIYIVAGEGETDIHLDAAIHASENHHAASFLRIPRAREVGCGPSGLPAFDRQETAAGTNSRCPTSRLTCGTPRSRRQPTSTYRNASPAPESP